MKLPTQIELSTHLLTVAQVAERLTVSRRSVWALIAAGRLTPLKLGPRTTRVDAAEVERFIEAARVRGERR